VNPADVLHLTLRRVFAGPGRAYVYVLCSKQNHVLYVGQTNDPGGVCARLAGHISARGTFRARLRELDELLIEEIEDLEVFAFALPPRAQYTSRDETWREGVEYNVQTLLIQAGADWRPYFRVVSRPTLALTIGFPEVLSLAQQIVSRLENLYNAPPTTA